MIWLSFYIIKFNSPKARVCKTQKGDLTEKNVLSAAAL